MAGHSDTGSPLLLGTNSSRGWVFGVTAISQTLHWQRPEEVLSSVFLMPVYLRMKR
jgi:hypothetical protein